MADTVIHRKAVRAIIFSKERNLVLLQEIENPEEGGQIWLLPGGGLNQDENPLKGLEREIFEETGQEINCFNGPVWRGVCKYKYGGIEYKQTEIYFITRVPKFNVVIEQNPDSDEFSLHKSWRWWSLEEIMYSNAVFSPRRLHKYLQNLLNNDAGECTNISFNP